MLNAPVPAARKALAKAGLKLEDIDLFEVNEAFAVVAEKFIRDLNIDRSKVNVNGGAMALGHPIGATGSMLIGTVLDELERIDGQLRPRHDVRRRWHGPGDHHRADLTNGPVRSGSSRIGSDRIGESARHTPGALDRQDHQAAGTPQSGW